MHYNQTGCISQLDTTEELHQLYLVELIFEDLRDKYLQTAKLQLGVNEKDLILNLKLELLLEKEMNLEDQLKSPKLQNTYLDFVF